MTELSLGLLVLGLLAGVALADQPSVSVADGTARQQSVRGSEEARSAALLMPRTWMHSTDALAHAYRRAGLLYAILPPALPAAVGPFDIDKPVRVDELVGMIAKANNVRLNWVSNIAVFEPPAAGADAAPPPAGDGPGHVRSRVSWLSARGDSSSVIELVGLAGHDDPSIRLHALAALQRIEGDFIRATYPGRLSVLQVLADRLDQESMLVAMESSQPTGGRAWKLAVELLGRARHRLLARYIWANVWQREPGTAEVGLWALGRCGDPSAGFAVRGWLGELAGNDPSHRYLAAMALGQIDNVDNLTRNRARADAELRRIIAFGLGFCRADNSSANDELIGFLGDEDEAVRFVACQSLARLGSERAIARLTQLARDQASAGPLRASALDGLVAMGRPEAEAVLIDLATDGDPVVRARVADLAGEVGGPKLANLLAEKLTADKDQFVQRAAVCSLARIGTDTGLKYVEAMLLDSENVPVDLQIASLLGLGRSLAPQAAGPLAAVAVDTARPVRIRNYAVLALARLANRAGQETLARLADPANPAFLSLAVRHLDLDNPKATAELLIPLLTHGSRDAACGAAGRLAELGSAVAIAELLEGGDVFDNHTRMMHMWGAVRGSGREATMALAAAARSRRASIRTAAAFALGGRLYPEAIDALLVLARDADPAVRAAAAQSLSVTPDPATVDALIELATRDEDLRVALEAAKALRSREFRVLPTVRKTFSLIAGTSRDPGGITDSPAIAEQPAHSFVLRSFADAVDEDIVCNLTYESSVCYDSGRGRIVQWGAHGRRYDSPQTGQTWFYDAATNRWRRLTGSRHWPNGTCCIRGTTYDVANRAVVSPRSGGGNGHGWHNALRANLAHSSPWVLDTQSDQWYPARPLSAEAGRMLPGSHDPVHGVSLWWNGGLFAFDVYANCWHRFNPPAPLPDCPGDTGGAFDPHTGRFIAVATGSTWAFDPAANTWADLKPDGQTPPACPMVYDSANDVMLAFESGAGQVNVWVYHLRENRWETLPADRPFPARGRIWDAAYDIANNVTVISGTSPFGFSASLNSRETWTYRYKPASGVKTAIKIAGDVQCLTAADGSVKLSWPPGDANVSRYRIERGRGQQPWLAKWEQIAEVNADTRTLADKPDSKALVFYRVIAIDDAGQASRPSLPARTAPRILSDVTAVAGPDGITVRWSPGQADIVGYNIYRAAVELGPAWSRQFAAERLAGRLERVNDQPLAATEFLDASARILEHGSELNWPRTFAYVVRPVNAWGIEGGASPVTLALLDPPGPVVAVPWADGRRLVLWSSCQAGPVAGYTLMRMDDWHAQHVFRLQPGVLASPAFWDGEEFPTGDRRRYYASGVDSQNTIGMPTSGAWSHGYP